MIYEKFPATNVRYWTTICDAAGQVTMEGELLASVNHHHPFRPGPEIEDFEFLRNLQEVVNRGALALPGDTEAEHGTAVAELNDRILEHDPVFGIVHTRYVNGVTRGTSKLVRVAKLRGFRFEPEFSRDSRLRVTKVIEGSNGRLYRRVDGLSILGRIASTS